jgi:hypothetical protein
MAASVPARASLPSISPLPGASCGSCQHRAPNGRSAAAAAAWVLEITDFGLPVYDVRPACGGWFGRGGRVAPVMAGVAWPGVAETRPVRAV